MPWNLMWKGTWCNSILLAAASRGDATWGLAERYINLRLGRDGVKIVDSFSSTGQSESLRTGWLNFFYEAGVFDMLWGFSLYHEAGPSSAILRPLKIGSLEKLFKNYLLAAQRIRKLEFRPGKPGFDMRGDCRVWNYVGTANSELLRRTCFREVFRDENAFFCLFWRVVQ